MKEQIGEGTYGQVYLMKEKATGDLVALKKVKMDNSEKEGFPITAIREIKILQALKHDNIINLREVCAEKDSKGLPGDIYMVFDYMEHDLTGLIDSGKQFTVAQIKCIVWQLLKGLAFCHKRQFIHRDLKCSNLLMNNRGVLKLGDFGLARRYAAKNENTRLTNKVITLWYRPPELLLGEAQYGTEVDLWSAGCIMAELLNGKAILTGQNELEQLEKIWALCGSPNEKNWPGARKLQLAMYIPKPEDAKPRRLRSHFESIPKRGPDDKRFDKHAIDLIDQLLTLDPKKRPSAATAAKSEYFWAEPLPARQDEMPQYESIHEFQAKKLKAQSRERMRRQRETDERSKRKRENVGAVNGADHHPHHHHQHSRTGEYSAKAGVGGSNHLGGNNWTAGPAPAGPSPAVPLQAGPPPAGPPPPVPPPPVPPPVNQPPVNQPSQRMDDRGTYKDAVYAGDGRGYYNNVPSLMQASGGTGMSRSHSEPSAMNARGMIPGGAHNNYRRDYNHQTNRYGSGRDDGRGGGGAYGQHGDQHGGHHRGSWNHGGRQGGAPAAGRPGQPGQPRRRGFYDAEKRPSWADERR